MPNIANSSVTFHVEVTDLLPVSAGRLSPYSVPCKPADVVYGFITGTGPGAGTKFYQINDTATAAVRDTDLTSVICSDGSVGFTHVRLVIVYNDSATSDLKFTVPTNGFASRWMGGTTPTITIAPGTFYIMAIPLAALGHLVDSTHKIIEVDPTAATINYRLVVVGD